MKLYDGAAERRTRSARADIPRGKRHHHSHRAGRPRQPATAAGGLYRDQSAAAVVRDDGAVLTESVAICRYFEALHLDPPLFGRDARESALIEMWNRRVLYIRVSTVFQHLHSAMKAMVDQQAPASGEANRPRIFDFLRLLDADWHAVVRRRHDLQRCRH